MNCSVHDRQPRSIFRLQVPSRRNWNPCCVQIVARHVGYATAMASARPVLWATTPLGVTILSSFAVGRVRHVTIAAFQSVLQVIL